jgi:hypothetical protein
MADDEKGTTAPFPENATSTTVVPGDYHDTAAPATIEDLPIEVSPDKGSPDASSPDMPNDKNIVYPKGLRLVLILLALCCAVFLVALDQTIIATAIPRITDQFNSISDIGWYGSSYLLTATALQPTFGKLYRVFDVSLFCLCYLCTYLVNSVEM